MNVEKCFDSTSPAYKKLFDCLLNIEDKILTGDDCLIDLANAIFSPLCEEVTFDEEYIKGEKDKLEEGIATAHLELGSENTWSGTPELTLRESSNDINVVYNSVEDDVEKTEEMLELGEEYESIFRKPVLSQLAVTSSFISHNNKPDLIPAVPVIMIII